MGDTCARCPRVFGRSCCEVRDGDRLATLTRADVERIAEATSRAPRTFCESEWLSHAEAADYERVRPVYQGYFNGAPERLTLRQRDGACVFHSAGAGCTLDEEARPVACRLYPFEPLPDGGFTLLVARQGSVELARSAGDPACLAVEVASSYGELAALLGASETGLRRLADALRADVLQHARPAARRAPRRRQSRWEPS